MRSNFVIALLLGAGCASAPAAPGVTPPAGCSVSTQPLPALDVVLDTAALLNAARQHAAGHVLLSVRTDTAGGAFTRRLESTLQPSATERLEEAFGFALQPPDSTTRFRVRVDAGADARVQLSGVVMCRPEVLDRSVLQSAVTRAAAGLPGVPARAHRVVLQIQVRADGTPGTITISRSSGYPVLDAAVALAVRNGARFSPGNIDGEFVPVIAEIPFDLTVRR